MVALRPSIIQSLDLDEESKSLLATAMRLTVLTTVAARTLTTPLLLLLLLALALLALLTTTTTTTTLLLLGLVELRLRHLYSYVRFYSLAIEGVKRGQWLEF
jgi:hypothetical protein